MGVLSYTILFKGDTMKEADNRLFNIILEKEYLNNIARTLKKSPIEAHKRIKRLEQKGCLFNRTYYDNGDIKHTLKMKLTKPLMHTAYLKLSDPNEFKCVVLSDMHDGHRLADIRLADYVYEHCIKNDIHVIINCGDFIDGSCGDTRQKIIRSPREQLEHFITEYPYERTILNYINLGDHEKQTLEQTGLDSVQVLKNNRPDFVPVGYGFGILNINNSQIFLEHKGCNVEYPVLQNKIILSGHSHAFAYNFYGDNLKIKIPSLSYLLYDRILKPRFLEITLSLDNTGNFNDIHLRSLSIEDNKLSENANIQMELGLQSQKPIRENSDGIHYTETVRSKKHKKRHK